MRASYGDTTGEYVALHSTAALVEDRYDVVLVRGADTVTFLDGILSQDIAGMEVGSVARSFLLQPQGKLVALLWVLRGDDEVLIVTDAGLGEAVLGQLRRFLLRVDVELSSFDGEVRTIIGPDAAAAVAGAGLEAAPGWRRRADTVVASLPLVAGIDRFVVIGPADLGALPPAGRLAVDALRVEVGEPVMGVDVDEGTIPQESGLVPASVSFTKGCYLGQELVARIDSRGRVNRRLMAILLTSNVLPPEGAELYAGDRLVGTLTSPSESLELRAPVGLSLLRREVDAGDLVEVRWSGGSAPAAVESLPTAVFTDS